MLSHTDRILVWQEMQQAVGDTLNTGVVPEAGQLRIRVWSLIWEEASRNPQAGSVLSDICVMKKSDVASCVSSEGWAESQVIPLRRGASPPRPCF